MGTGGSGGGGRADFLRRPTVRASNTSRMIAYRCSAMRIDPRSGVRVNPRSGVSGMSIDSRAGVRIYRAAGVRQRRMIAVGVGVRPAGGARFYASRNALDKSLTEIRCPVATIAQ